MDVHPLAGNLFSLIQCKIIKNKEFPPGRITYNPIENDNPYENNNNNNNNDPNHIFINNHFPTDPFISKSLNIQIEKIEQENTNIIKELKIYNQFIYETKKKIMDQAKKLKNNMTDPNIQRLTKQVNER